jgi:hypothetical protein
MTRSADVPAWRGRLLRSLASVVVLGGFTAGSLAVAHADPSATPTPNPTPASAQPGSSAPAAGPTAAGGIVTSGGAATSNSGTSTTATAGTGTAGSAASGTGTTSTGATASGDVLDQLAEDYAVGTGGGQLSNLLKTSLKLRNMGFRPTKQYYDEIRAAMAYRPNQNPLIAALKDTIAYQQKIRAQMEILQQSQSKNANSAVMGAGQMPADSNPGQLGTSTGSGQAPGAQAAMPAMPAAPVAPAPAAPAVSAEAP